MLAAAAVTTEIDLVIAAGLSAIPRDSRLATAVHSILDSHRQGLAADTVIDGIHHNWQESREYDWCHTIPNAMVVITSLLYGGNDLEKILGISLASGFDTDCNCATAGSICGMLLGARALPEKWISPLNDTVISGVAGLGQVSISSLAERTAGLIQQPEEVNNER